MCFFLVAVGTVFVIVLTFLLICNLAVSSMAMPGVLFRIVVAKSFTHRWTLVIPEAVFYINAE